MKVFFSHFISLSLFITSAYSQNVGIGTTIPVSKLHVSGTANNPSIPGNASTGIFRIGINTNEGIDFGKMGSPSFAGWIQSGFNDTLANSLTLQPVGGNVGIGTTTPNATLHVNGKVKIVDGSQGLGKVFISDANGLGSWATTAGITGTGTLNYIPKWTPDGTALGSSSIYDSLGNIGIGTTHPLAKFHSVNGALFNSGLKFDTLRIIGNTDFKRKEWLRFEPLAKSEGNLPFRVVQGSHRFVSGLIPDETMQLGWNIQGEADSDFDLSKPTILQQFEQQYINTGVDNSEYILAWRKSGDSVTHRLDAWYMANNTGNIRNDKEVNVTEYHNPYNYNDVYAAITSNGSHFGGSTSLDTLTTPIIYGVSSAGGNLSLSSTSNTTKGKVFFGSNSVYDELNDRWGIGTTTPGQNFEITGNSAFRNYQLIYNGSTLSGFLGAGNLITSGATASDLTVAAIGKLILSSGNSGTSQVVIDANGNVGIGTSMPATKLLVAGAVTYSTTATPADPASGNTVNWFDGTNMKWKKNVSGTVTSGTLY